MPARDRGWHVKGRTRHVAFSPRQVAVSTSWRSKKLKGAVVLGRGRGLPEYRPWSHVPAGWLSPVTEWAVMWYLTKYGVGPEHRKLLLNRDFFYQKALAAPGLFFRKPFTRGDFVLPGFGQGGAHGLVIDPISFFTHPQPWFDKRKRRILRLQGWQVVFIEDYMLTKNHPRYVMELALRGIDISHLGAGLL